MIQPITEQARETNANVRPPASIVGVCLSALLCIGCAQLAPPQATIEATAASTPARNTDSVTAAAWSSASFRFITAPGKPPDWRLDLLVADQVVAPVLQTWGEGIELWRVHRRAAPDASGHQLTLFAYVTPELARTIFTHIQQHPLIERLAREGRLRQLLLTEGGPQTRPELEDTSDPQWSPSLARAWPWFIQGVSETWLSLIAAHTPPAIVAPVSAEPLDATLARYGQARAAIGTLWREEGGHAFLHHISAVFGYERLLLRF